MFLLERMVCRAAYRIDCHGVADRTGHDVADDIGLVVGFDRKVVNGEGACGICLSLRGIETKGRIGSEVSR